MASRRARQQRDRIRQIGVLSPFSENDSETKTRLTAFKDRLNSLVGLTAAMSGSNTGSQRENIERTRDAAVELVALGSDAIVAYANPAVSGAEADYQHCPDRFHPSVRSARKRIRHGPRASRWRHYWIPQFRTCDRWEMAGGSQADRPFNASRGGRPRSENSRQCFIFPCGRVRISSLGINVTSAA